jgi:hypothetical protein
MSDFHTALRDRIADRLHAVMHTFEYDVALMLADAVVGEVEPDLDRLADVAAHAIVLAAGINPRDSKRARQGMHRRMYVEADRMVRLLDVLETLYPGAVAEARTEEELPGSATCPPR